MKNIQASKQFAKHSQKSSAELDKLKARHKYLEDATKIKVANYTTKLNSDEESYYYAIEAKLADFDEKIQNISKSEYDLKKAELNKLLEEKYWDLRKNHEAFKAHHEEESLVNENLESLLKDYEELKHSYELDLENYSRDPQNEAEVAKLKEDKNAYFKKALLDKVLKDQKEINKLYNQALKEAEKKAEKLSEELDFPFDQEKINSLIQTHLDLVEAESTFEVQKYLELNQKRKELLISLKQFVIAAKAQPKIEKADQKVQNKTEESKKLQKEYLEGIDEEEAEDTKAFVEMTESDELHLRVVGLKMYFGGLKAVDDLTFDIKRGEIFSLIGPNGAGKTTVFNCITKFYNPTAGRFYLNRRNGQTVILNDYKVQDVIKQGISRTFQNVELILELNVFENLLVGAHSLYRTGFFSHMFRTPRYRMEEKILQAKAFQILHMLELDEYMFSYPAGLPYGILKRIELARALMTDPELIILDEPAAGLNDTETKELAKLIVQLRDQLGLTIFLVEHDMGLVMDISDRVCVISFGKMLAIGTPKEVQNDPVVRRAYLGGDKDE